MAVYQSDTPLRRSSRSRGEWSSAISRMAGGFVRFREAIRDRRSIGHLLKLDDRLLNDIGLTRGDIVAALSGPLYENAGLRLSRLARERRFARARRPCASRDSDKTAP